MLLPNPNAFMKAEVQGILCFVKTILPISDERMVVKVLKQDDFSFFETDNNMYLSPNEKQELPVLVVINWDDFYCVCQGDISHLIAIDQGIHI